MTTHTTGAIIVGVTGRGKETAALRFAADRARAEGAEVVLVHAYHAEVPAAPPAMLITYVDAIDVAQWVVKDVAEEFAELTNESPVPFRTAVVAGSPARVLVGMSDHARMVVVQHRRHGGLGRIFVGSTAYGTAAHAACPVVSVNENWNPTDAVAEVVVGLHEGGGPRQALEAAFAWAAATGSRLRVVHAWRLDAAYDDIITARVADQWRTEQTEALTDAVAELRELHPDVDVIIEVRHHWPSDVLVDDARAASLVVVGRHAAHPWALERLGSIARTVLGHAECPVMVVPTQADGPSDWGLTADDVSPQT